ncbi:MAG: hypothetical protein IIX15_01275 [Clostridia bacterium]|nr:hypothetical protein [Clostridia bacterium]
MKCRYEAVKERVHSDELGEYETFGIRVTTEIASVSDVSIDGARVDELCRQFNERDLSPLRLLDAIDKGV